MSHFVSQLVSQCVSVFQTHNRQVQYNTGSWNWLYPARAYTTLVVLDLSKTWTHKEDKCCPHIAFNLVQIDGTLHSKFGHSIANCNNKWYLSRLLALWLRHENREMKCTKGNQRFCYNPSSSIDIHIRVCHSPFLLKTFLLSILFGALWQ